MLGQPLNCRRFHEVIGLKIFFGQNPESNEMLVFFAAEIVFIPATLTAERAGCGAVVKVVASYLRVLGVDPDIHVDAGVGAGAGTSGLEVGDVTVIHTQRVLDGIEQRLGWCVDVCEPILMIRNRQGVVSDREFPPPCCPEHQ
jgi:hypothetical protein